MMHPGSGNIPRVDDAEQFIYSELKMKLSETLFYHDLNHSIDVAAAAKIIGNATSVSEESQCLLRTAAAFHDSGFIEKYKGHEEVSCAIAKTTLPRFGFDEPQITAICGMIMATKIPQQPTTPLECVLADADLDYLGRDDARKIAQQLYHELKQRNLITDEKHWLTFQINFLSAHHYHTSFSQQFREPKKQAYLAGLKTRLADLDENDTNYNDG